MLPIAGSCEKIGAIFKTIFRSPKGQRSVAPRFLASLRKRRPGLSVLYSPLVKRARVLESFIGVFDGGGRYHALQECRTPAKGSLPSNRGSDPLQP